MNYSLHSEDDEKDILYKLHTSIRLFMKASIRLFAKASIRLFMKASIRLSIPAEVYSRFFGQPCHA